MIDHELEFMIIHIIAQFKRMMMVLENLVNLVE